MASLNPYLDPLNQALVNRLAGVPGADMLTPQQVRVNYRAANAHEQIPGVNRTRIQVPVSNGTETWIYYPEGAVEPLPYIFYIHGGGFVAGDIDVYDSVASDLVVQTGYALVFPEYARAPEVQFPSIHEQVFSVLEWTTENGNDHGLVSDNFAVVSDSAGGHIAFGVNVLAQQHEPPINISYNVFLSPATSADQSAAPTESEYLYFNTPVASVPALNQYIDWYMPNKTDQITELGSPVLVSNGTASAFAPSLIIVSAVDILRSDSVTFGEKLQQAGRDVTILVADGQVHNSVALVGTRFGPTPQSLLKLIVAEIKSRLASK